MVHLCLPFDFAYESLTEASFCSQLSVAVYEHVIRSRFECHFFYHLIYSHYLMDVNVLLKYHLNTRHSFNRFSFQLLALWESFIVLLACVHKSNKVFIHIVFCFHEKSIFIKNL